MKMHQEMKNQQIFGNHLGFQQKELVIWEQVIIGGQLDQLDLVALIQRYFTG